jgi:hypothetical protein
MGRNGFWPLGSEANADKTFLLSHTRRGCKESGQAATTAYAPLTLVTRIVILALIGVALWHLFVLVAQLPAGRRMRGAHRRRSSS